ncbi:MAG: DUF1570 domain-containing protein [Fuerstiella sp.]
MLMRPLTCLLLLALFFDAETAEAQASAVDDPPTVSSVQLKSESGTGKRLMGRVVAQTQDGSILLEERSGRVHVVSSDRIDQLTDQGILFQPLTVDEMAAELLRQTGAGFAIHRTDNYVICSDASEVDTEFCGRLLQRVAEEYQQFFADSEITLRAVPRQLPVIIFRDTVRFQEFARQQHPDTDFADVPGYYSVRDNQMLITAVSGDREFRTNGQLIRELKNEPRQVETVVHEAVHQLAFNTGLQVRYADNPLWLSEGLAVYFEHAAGSSNTVWHRPGGVGRLHFGGFRQASAEGRLRLPLSELLTSDKAFQTAGQNADAYAESWALVHFLVRTDRAAFDRYLVKLQKRTPLRAVPGSTRLKELQQATGMTANELEASLLRYMARLRSPR